MTRKSGKFLTRGGHFGTNRTCKLILQGGFNTWLVAKPSSVWAKRKYKFHHQNGGVRTTPSSKFENRPSKIFPIFWRFYNPKFSNFGSKFQEFPTLWGSRFSTSNPFRDSIFVNFFFFFWCLYPSFKFKRFRERKRDPYDSHIPGTHFA